MLVGKGVMDGVYVGVRLGVQEGLSEGVRVGVKDSVLTGVTVFTGIGVGLPKTEGRRSRIRRSNKKVFAIIRAARFCKLIHPFRWRCMGCVTST